MTTPGELAVEHTRCPYCRAAPGASCVTRAGRAAPVHASRVEPILRAWAAGYTEGGREARDVVARYLDAQHGRLVSPKLIGQIRHEVGRFVQ